MCEIINQYSNSALVTCVDLARSAVGATGRVGRTRQSQWITTTWTLLIGVGGSELPKAASHLKFPATKYGIFSLKNLACFLLLFISATKFPTSISEFFLIVKLHKFVPKDRRYLKANMKMSPQTVPFLGFSFIGQFFRKFQRHFREKSH